MDGLVARLLVAISLSGCELLMPVTAEDARGEAGRYIHRTDVGGYYRYDDGHVEVVPPWRR